VEHAPDVHPNGPDRGRLDRDGRETTAPEPSAPESGRWEFDGAERDGPLAARSVPPGVLVWIVAVVAVLVAVGWFVKIRAAGTDDTAGITAVPYGIAPAENGPTGSGGSTGPANPPARTPSEPPAPTATSRSPQPTPMSFAVSGAWVDNVASRTGIPVRALTAYADAQLATNVTEPACHLSWVMLAGIGSVESGHGSHGGAVLRPDGTSSAPILGPPLDGTHGNIAVHATAAGVRLDGDPRWDHAVGPMQFLPSTWTHWGVSATGGVPDPNDIDDAALTAARYLCGDHRNLSTLDGWRAALAAYNAPDAYAVKVTDTAETYARASLG
jgi:hypothetical protein